MGSCVSKPDNSVSRRGSIGGGRRKKRSLVRRVGRRKKVMAMETTGYVVDGHVAAAEDSRLRSGSLEEEWFETVTVVESDSEEDFHSLHEEMYHSHSSEGESMSSTSSCKEVTKRNSSVSSENYACNQGQSNKSLSGSKESVTGEDISNRFYEDDKEVFVSCGNIIQNNCLQRITATTPIIEKRKSFTSSPLNSPKKATSKLLSKSKSAEALPTLFSSKSLLRRPLAGSQIPFYLAEKVTNDSWSYIDPGTFKVRGENYLRDKKKILAQNHAAYYPYGVDVYLSEKKINHIARFIELPAADSFSDLPPLLVVNVQIPLYPAAIFQNITDGEGFSFVLYFRLSETCSKELPSHFVNNIKRLIDDEDEKIKSFPVETTVPFRERLKILGRVVNIDDLPLNTAERALMHKYNEKPILSRPQHAFYAGENYFEIVLDMHRFSYISRKGFETFLDRLKLCVLDVGLTIQGNSSEELPEQILCCVRLNGIDYTKYHPLATH